MSLTLQLTPEESRKLADLARALGQEPAEHARDVVAAYLEAAGPRDDRSFAEVLAPFWEGWRRSGLTEDEVDDLLERELQGARSDQRRVKEST